ncbi:MAG: hypothetical protein WDN75_00100 [Bacteroidota bacterium]
MNAIHNYLPVDNPNIPVKPAGSAPGDIFGEFVATPMDEKYFYEPKIADVRSKDMYLSNFSMRISEGRFRGTWFLTISETRDWITSEAASFCRVSLPQDINGIKIKLSPTAGHKISNMIRTMSTVIHVKRTIHFTSFISLFARNTFSNSFLRMSSGPKT